ncbi:hypothetical protein [Rhodococcus artemisiae]|uniref:Major facilitator superfamily (MFS) profile domain-containing protein n=1 Tax=Rhodococcus artemisiae TaxID=714159 RepID=A0ABU7L8T1_9NOCA|nr:hypothetical protein [Rhodococcus artemisiae]MEE2057954.1 hypothetical protein [Rhodococcus artemisiae]
MTSMSHDRADEGLQRSTRRTIDAVVTALFIIVTIVFAAVAFFVSLLFPMGMDSCGPDGCQEGYLTAASAVTWGGIAVAVAGTVVGVVTAARRRVMMWVWPLLGATTIAVVLIVGLNLAERAG